MDSESIASSPDGVVGPPRLTVFTVGKTPVFLSCADVSAGVLVFWVSCAAELLFGSPRKIEREVRLLHSIGLHGAGYAVAVPVDVSARRMYDSTRPVDKGTEFDLPVVPKKTSGKSTRNGRLAP